jgi:hypothetical protein
MVAAVSKRAARVYQASVHAAGVPAPRHGTVANEVMHIRAPTDDANSDYACSDRSTRPAHPTRAIVPASTPPHFSRRSPEPLLTAQNPLHETASCRLPPITVDVAEGGKAISDAALLSVTCIGACLHVGFPTSSVHNRSVRLAS